MSTSQKLIAICPECKHETIYNGVANRPRITCKECKTRFYLKTQKTQKESKVPKSINKPDTETKGGQHSTSPLTKANLAEMSIKAKLKLLGESAVDEYLLTGSESRILSKAIDLLSKEEFIEQGEIIDGVFWTSEIPPYERPPFLYPHQKVAMKLMDLGHLLWQASRQLAGKTTCGLIKDFEEMLETPHYTIALVAPTLSLIHI